MRRRILRSIVLATVTVLLISLALILGVLYGYTTNVTKAQLKEESELTVRGVEEGGIRYLKRVGLAQTRITWIAADGSVRFDNREADPSGMENHLNRQEVQEALQFGSGTDDRFSATLLERCHYIATRLSDGSVLRLSVSQYSILSLLLGMIQPVLLILAFAFILSFVLAGRLARAVVKPLNELNLDDPVKNQEYDELSPLLHRIGNQEEALHQQSAELERKQNELESILENMTEGMILLGKQGNIILINAAAGRLLGADRHCIGRDILMVSRNISLQAAISKALGGRKESCKLALRDGMYQLNATPIRYQGHMQGVAVLLFDITIKEQAEEFRREFTGNVSHELRTPLHAISGYAELLKNGLVKQEDVRSFADQIYGETQRMIQLVEDIISLSHLDEGASDMAWEEIDLLEAAKLSVSRLKGIAETGGITITASGDSARIYGIPGLIQTLLTNLADNAVKYNRSGGRAELTVRKQEDGVLLTVTDTGIGIPKEEQQRIFERFYRVDKSHSKAVGGTGLGLSIVKHIAMIHGGRPDVSSTLNEGTKISVLFPAPEDAKKAHETPTQLLQLL